jgi:iron complex outermembrane receptor protein
MSASLLVLASTVVALPTAAFSQTESSIRPPAVETKVDAVYPADALASGRKVTVAVRVTVGADGSVTNPEIVESGGPQFDAAALTAIRQWKFRPAMRADTPVASRIRVPFLFVPPGAAPLAPPADGGIAVAPQISQRPSEGGADGGIVASTPDAGNSVPEVTQVPSPAPPAPERPDGGSGAREETIDVTVVGHRRPPSRGTSDYQIETEQLAQVPRANASDFLKLAPGILLTNEGGEGHAEQVFLRGFDAREGQAVEFTVDGIPINESGNLHGNGYADTHFIIPELVESLRVVEGPFDPRQGNYAEAGSADYHLGLQERGLFAKLSAGSFGTRRALLAFGPPSKSSTTFAALELYQTDGYGQNRDGRRASGMAQYEGHVGDSLYRITAQAYTASFHSAGFIREDDYLNGRVGFYDTYDPLQGEDGARYSIAAALESHAGDFTFNNQVYAIHRPLRIRENFTGFLLDVQEPQQSPHGQRGDLIDQNILETTLGARGSGKLAARLFDRPQEIEFGYFARHDITSALQQRVEAATGHPYKTEVNLDSSLDDIGLYVDANLHPLRWLTVRGGVRSDLFTFSNHDLCAVQSVEHPSPSNPQTDVSCQSQENFGAHREPDQFASTSGTATMPRGSVLFGPWSGVTFSVSAGRGVRSIDPIYVTQDKATPFASVKAYEAGVTVEEELAPLVRVIFNSTVFLTKVDQDLIFDQTAGRNTLAGATTRIGSANALRVSGPSFDVSVNGTYVHATFDDDSLLIPYIPDLVLRSDAAVWHDLPWDSLLFAGHLPQVTLATGVTYVGPRPLPFGARSDVIFTIDANLTFGWPALQFGISATNLLDRKYPLSELNIASDFHSQSEPTLVPVRHFTAGAPRAVLFTVGFNFGATP